MPSFLRPINASRSQSPPYRRRTQGPKSRARQAKYLSNPENRNKQNASKRASYARKYPCPGVELHVPMYEPTPVVPVTDLAHTQSRLTEGFSFIPPEPPVIPFIPTLVEQIATPSSSLPDINNLETLHRKLDQVGGKNYKSLLTTLSKNIDFSAGIESILVPGIGQRLWTMCNQNGTAMKTNTRKQLVQSVLWTINNLHLEVSSIVYKEINDIFDDIKTISFDEHSKLKVDAIQIVPDKTDAIYKWGITSSSYDPMHINYIYLIERHCNSGVYKIGMTTQENHKRLNQYPKGSILVFQTRCHNCKKVESLSIQLFIQHFKRRLDFGNEYFEGKPQLMVCYILQVISTLETCKSELETPIADIKCNTIIKQKQKLD
jgi:hypothetical protein